MGIKTKIDRIPSIWGDKKNWPLKPSKLNKKHHISNDVRN
ncbi:hypothetical protein XIS1_1560003 [Xenorhabdus innexi]|uniref:Uncharacterized protein n=1 Tax=Xenorhabdus innexi TaxID=290109 RepID=A0A1N6MUN6_9GAMM|nr:hypothetical protein XIS1_1560003 [Xenorhabdus innexi]